MCLRCSELSSLSCCNKFCSWKLSSWNFWLSFLSSLFSPRSLSICTLKIFYLLVWNLCNFFPWREIFIWRNSILEAEHCFWQSSFTFWACRFEAGAFGSREFRHWMHGKAGCSFAKWAQKYPEDVEVTWLWGQLIDEKLVWLFEAASTYDLAFNDCKKYRNLSIQ